MACERLRLGRPSKCILMIGLRGVGKTVLLDRMREDVKAAGIHTIRIEAPEGRSLPALLAPRLRLALLRLSTNVKAKKLAVRALRGLAGFAKALKVKFGDIEVGLDLEPEPGLADNGDLEHDLQALLELIGAAELGRSVTALGPTRNQLISKGPGHGGTALTVPLFDEFMKRIVPGGNWRK